MKRQILEELAEAVGAEHAPLFYRQFEERLPGIIHEGLTAQQHVSKINHAAQHRGVDGIGQCEVRFAPPFKRMVALLFGPELATDEKFLKEIERDNCHIKLKPTYDRKATIIVAKPVNLQTIPKTPATLETVPR